jgi:hypothetical protein
LQGASLKNAQLQGAWLTNAQLQGAWLTNAQLQDAWLFGVQLQGASLDFAELQGAWLTDAQLQGASLNRAQLQGAWLSGVQLQDMWRPAAQLQGASLNGAQLQGARLANVLVWRAFGTPDLDLAELADIDANEKPWEDNETFGKWRDTIANSVPAGPLREKMKERLAVLDPGEKEPDDVLDQRYWDWAHSSKPQGEDVLRTRAVFLADQACVGDLPYVARGLLRNLKPKGGPEFLDAGGLKLFTARLLKGKSDPTTCLGVRGFTDTDWAELSKLGSETLMSR